MRGRLILVLVIVLIVIVGLIGAKKIWDSARSAKAEPIFKFAAVGDFGANSNTTGVLSTIKDNNVNFSIALGDLSYNQRTPESAWCDYVKGIVGSSFPFELIGGNHDTEGSSQQGDINNFASCLSDRIGSLTGTYAKEYYFDYQNMARFIYISPDLTIDGADYDYTSGNAHYTWLSNAIDDARADGITWVIVSMHKVCLTTGVKTCEIGPDLLNLLVNKKVDLVLQGHEHNYQRSHQLALNGTCSSITPNTYNNDCVAGDGSNNLYDKGLGSVFVIVGTGGNSLYDTSSSDSEANYFANTMGANKNPTYGAVKVDVYNTKLDVSYIKSGSGSFSDSFSIDNNAGPTIYSHAVDNTSTETGGTGKIGFTLLSRPGANVTIPLSVNDSSEGTLSGTTEVSLSPSTWNQLSSTQVTVTGVDDTDRDGSINYQLVSGDPTSADSGYNALGASDVADKTLVNIDDELLKVEVHPRFHDQNGDGRDELSFVRLNHSSGNVEVVTYSPESNYQQLQNILFSGYPTVSANGAVIPLFHDQNGDGRDELSFVRLNHSSGNVEIVTYTPESNYQNLRSVSLSGYPSVAVDGAVIPLFHDIDGDNKDELSFVRLNHSSGNVEIVTYSPESNYQQLRSVSFSGYPALPADGAVIPLFHDIDGDNKDELSFVRLNHSSGNVETVTYSSQDYRQLKSIRITGYPTITPNGYVRPLFHDLTNDSKDELSFLRLNHSSGNVEVVTYHPAGFTQLVGIFRSSYPNAF